MGTYRKNMFKKSWIPLVLISAVLFLTFLTNSAFAEESIPISEGFDYPVGKPNGNGYYDAQNFGSPNNNFGGKYHLGEDWNSLKGGDRDLGDPVYSASNGKIMYYEKSRSGWGGVLIIKHRLPDSSEVTSFYGHLKEIYKTSGIVSRGEKIGTMGKGNINQYPAHLHFEIRTNTNIDVGPGYSWDLSGWTDPSEFIDSHRQLLSPPQAVTLSTSNVTHNSATLSWTKNQSPYFSSYKLYRGETSPVTESSQLIATITDEDQTTFTDSSLLPNKNYFYKAYACNIANQCTGSNEVQAQTQKDPNDQGKITYTSEVNGYSQIFVMDVGTKSSTQLTSSNSNNRTPKWSPDGKTIVYSSFDSTTGKRQVFLMNSDGSEPRKITNAKFSAEQEDWFPDGQRIAYLGFDQVEYEGITTNIKGIFVMDINGNAPTLVTPPTIYPYNPAVSPDGQKIVFNADYASVYQKGGIFIVNADGSNLIQLTSENDSNPEISPDNKSLVFSSTRETNHNWFWDVFLTTEDYQGIVFSLTGAKNDGSSNVEPSWSPDSKKIVFSRRFYDFQNNKWSDFEITALDLETNTTQTLTDNLVDDREPDWRWE